MNLGTFCGCWRVSSRKDHSAWWLPLVVLLGGWVAWTSAAAWADDPPSLATVKAHLDKARAALDAERPAAAREHLVAAVSGLVEWEGMENPPPTARSMVERARGLRDDIELQGGDIEGIELPAIKSAPRTPARRPARKDPELAMPKGKPTGRAPAVAKGGATGKGSEPKPQAGGVSFVGQVAPMLLRHCGGCHVAGKKGDFQFTSFETLMKSGFVQTGTGADSRLVEVIRTGDMPRGGGKVSAEESALLVRWIDEGAVFDGSDPLAALQNAGRPQPPPVVPTGPVALKPGDVSFAFEVAPILVKQCGGCHDATQPDGNLSMVSLETLLRGGATGAPIIAGEGAASLLIRKLKGKEIDGQQMPLSKPPLSDEVIEAIEKWIDQGAALDLLTAQTSLETVAAAGRARSLSHEELLAARFDAADAVWRRAIADEEPASVTRGTLRVIGNLPESKLERLADAAEKAMTAVESQLVAGDVPLIKGGIVLLAFDKPYDYSDFWINVLGDERPKGMESRPGMSGDVIYGSFIAPALDTAEARADTLALLAEEIAAAAFLSRGAPEWFAVGAGRAVATKTAAKSAGAKGWRSESTQRLQNLRRPAAIVEGLADPASTAAVSGAFVIAVGGGGGRLKALAERLDDAIPFDAAFAEVFQGSPEAVFGAWAEKELTRQGEKRGDSKKRVGNAGR